MDVILNKIKEYNTIIIHRHNNPDLDALGSQLGLKEIIKLNWPEKKVYAVGDENRFSYAGKMDQIDDKVYEGSLVIIVDVSQSTIISDYRYFLANEVVIIDHHTNPVILDTNGKKFDKQYYNYSDTSSIACSLIIAEFIQKENLKINDKIATLLYSGLVTDSGRFMYGSDLARSFIAAAYLVNNGANAQELYNRLYTESLEDRKLKNYLQGKIMYTKNNVLYLMNDKDIYAQYHVDVFSLSRGMVNIMAGVEESKIWANFTYNPENGKVMCELRSRGISEILDIAKSYGGGGHPNACGVTVDNFEIANEILQKLDELAGTYNVK